MLIIDPAVLRLLFSLVTFLPLQAFHAVLRAKSNTGCRRNVGEPTSPRAVDPDSPTAELEGQGGRVPQNGSIN